MVARCHLSEVWAVCCSFLCFLHKAPALEGGPVRLLLDCQQHRLAAGEVPWVILPDMARLEYNPHDYKRLCENEAPLQDPVMLIWRFDYANVYHALERLMGALQTALILELDPARTHIAFVDGHPVHTLDPLWEASFAQSTDLIAHARARKPLCLRKAVLPSSSRTGSLWSASFANQNPCMMVWWFLVGPLWVMIGQSSDRPFVGLDAHCPLPHPRCGDVPAGCVLLW